MTMETAVQLSASEIGANLGAILMAASYYPIEDEADEATVRTSVRLPVSEHDRVEFLADLWNALDEAGNKTRGKWLPASVIRRLVHVGLESFASQIGGWPATKEEREEMIARAGEVIAKLKK